MYNLSGPFYLLYLWKAADGTWHELRFYSYSMNYEATKGNLKSFHNVSHLKSNSAKSFEFLCNAEWSGVRHILLGERTFICPKKSYLLGLEALGKSRLARQSFCKRLVGKFLTNMGRKVEGKQTEEQKYSWEWLQINWPTLLFSILIWKGEGLLDM